MKDLRLGDVVASALEAQERGTGTVIATVVSSSTVNGPRPGVRMVISETGEVDGHVHPALDSLLAEHAIRALDEKRSRLRSYRLMTDGVEQVGAQQGDVDIYFEVLSRPPRLIIVGAGHIAVPLARLGALLEYEVSVLDDRPEFANAERFPWAGTILVGPYAETLAGVPIDADTHIVLVTRGHVHDQACLEQVIDSPAAYIGMIGSKRRVRTVLDHIEAAGGDATRLRQVHAPVGLDIGARTPAEIALAIMAEIVNVRRGGPALSLSQGRARV